jgi:hypothetical protein
MTQPSGRVLNIPAQHRTYLRSSPIFCALDALSFLVKLVRSCLPPPGVPRSQAIARVIRQRYRDVDDEAAEGIQSLEKMTVLRWVFFLLGTLGPAVKLCAMEGVSWTKAWGVMYLASFVVFEVMGFVNEYLLWRYDDNIQIPLRSEDRIEAVDDLLFGLAVLGHSVLLVFAVLDLWELRAPEAPWPHLGNGTLHLLIGSHSSSFLLCIPAWICLITVAELRIAVCGNTWHWRTEDRKKMDFFALLAVGQCGYILTMLSKLEVLSELELDGEVILIDNFFFILAYASPYLLLFSILLLCTKFPSLGTKLLVRHEMDSRDSLALVFFITNVVVCILWYSLRYNSENTANPAWTSIWG